MELRVGRFVPCINYLTGKNSKETEWASFGPFLFLSRDGHACEQGTISPLHRSTTKLPHLVSSISGRVAALDRSAIPIQHPSRGLDALTWADTGVAIETSSVRERASLR